MQSARAPPDAPPSGPCTAPEPAPRPAAPPRVGAELIAPGDRFVLWCAQDAVRPVLDALKDAGVDTRRDGPLDRFHHSSLHEARRRRHRRASVHSDDAGCDAPLPPVANCAEAMACSEFTDAPVFSFDAPVAAYARVAKALKRRKLVHPNYTAEADGGPEPRRAMIPSSTFLAVTAGVRSEPAARPADRRVDCVAGGAARLGERHSAVALRDAALDPLRRVPRSLRDALLPFQERGVHFGLERHGRCLIADEMGVGKTIQALAIASCFLRDGPMLVVCPASMRLAWAREAERWLPELTPANLVVVNGSADTFAVDEVRAVAESREKAREEERLWAARAAAGFGGDAAEAETKPNFFDETRARAPGRDAGDAGDVNGDVDAEEDVNVGVDAKDTESLRARVAMLAARRARREAERPRVVVVSFQMAARLRRRLRAARWGAVVVDESHALRTARRDGGDNEQTSAVLGLVRACARAVLCTGTPSLTKPFDLFNQVDALRPGLLGGSRRAFAETYCDAFAKKRYDRTGGSRLQELHALLTREVMIRRLKSQVLADLPPKRRQVVPVDTSGSGGGGEARVFGGEESETSGESDEGETSDDERVHERRSRARAERALEDAGASRGRMSRHRDAALVKLPGAIKWLKEVLRVEDGGKEAEASAAAEPLDAEAEAAADEASDAAPKMVIFAHHKDVMDSIANQVLYRLPRVPARGAAAHAGLPPSASDADASARAREKTRVYVEGFVRLEGATPPAERGEAVDRFRDDPGCRVALVSVTAGGVGVDLSASSSVVFVELPPDASMVEQAEDRVHRRGVRGAVNVYFLLAHGGAAGRVEQRRWAAIERQLNRVRRAVDGEDAVHERGLALDGVGVGFRHGPERREPRRLASGSRQNASAAAEADFTASWLGEASDEKENGERRAGSDDSVPYAPPPPPTNLWFELSANTGRLHLHASADGAEPLGQSVAPHDLRCAAEAVRRAAKKNARSAAAERLAAAAADDDALCARLRGDAGAILAAATFADELDALTARDRNALAHGHVPARSPVAETLRALHGDAAAEELESRFSTSASTTRHGGGRRRALPPGATWRPVLVRHPVRRGEVRQYLEPYRRGDGAPLCLLCMSARGGPVGSGDRSAQSRDAAAHPETSADPERPTDPSARLLFGSGSGSVASNPGAERYPASPRGAAAAAREAVAAAEASLRAAAAAESALRRAGDGGGGALSAAQNVSRRIQLAQAASRAKVATRRLDEARERADRAARAARAEGEPSATPSDEQPRAAAHGACLGSAASSAAFPLDSKADLFCSARCAALDKQMRSASELRKLLYARERGVCRACRWDASGCARRIATMRSRGARRKHILSSNPAFGACGNAKQLERLARTAWEGDAWHFDHVVAVYEGGGECTVDNGQTLCVLCHKARTAAQAKARADARRAAKKRSSSASEPTKTSVPRRVEKKKKTAPPAPAEDDSGSARALFEETAAPPAVPAPSGTIRRFRRDSLPRSPTHAAPLAGASAHAEDSQLVTTDEEAEEAEAAREGRRGENVGETEEDAPVFDSEPIPETEPI